MLSGISPSTIRRACSRRSRAARASSTSAAFVRATCRRGATGRPARSRKSIRIRLAPGRAAATHASRDEAPGVRLASRDESASDGGLGLSRVLLQLLRLFRWALKRLPLSWALAGAVPLGVLASWLKQRDLRTGVAQIRFALRHELAADPAIAERQARAIAKANAVHAYRAAFEFLLFEKLLAPQPTLSPRPEENFRFIRVVGHESLLASGPGNQSGVLLSGHVGCFELIGGWLVRCGRPLSVVGRPPHYEAVGEMLDQLRIEYGVETIWRNDRASIAKLVRAMKTGRLIAVLIDQDVDLENGFADFFGLPAASPITMLRFAIKHRLPIHTGFIVREESSRQCITFQPLRYDPGSPGALQQILDTYNERLAALIRAHPEQWPWWHKRWRRRPGIDYAREPQLLRRTAEYVAWMRQLAATAPGELARAADPHLFAAPKPAGSNAALAGAQTPAATRAVSRD